MWAFVLIMLLINVVLFGVIAVLYRMLRQQAGNLEALSREMHRAAEAVPDDAPEVLRAAADDAPPGDEGDEEAEDGSANP